MDSLSDTGVAAVTPPPDSHASGTEVVTRVHMFMRSFLSLARSRAHSLSLSLSRARARALSSLSLASLTHSLILSRARALSLTLSSPVRGCSPEQDRVAAYVSVSIMIRYLHYRQCSCNLQTRGPGVIERNTTVQRGPRFGVGVISF